MMTGGRPVWKLRIKFVLLCKVMKVLYNLVQQTGLYVCHNINYSAFWFLPVKGTAVGVYP